MHTIWQDVYMVVMAMDTRTRILPRQYVNYAYTSSSVGTNDETKNSKISNSKSSFYSALVRTVYGRTYGHSVITKFSELHGLLPFSLTYGAPQAAFGRWSSAIKQSFLFSLLELSSFLSSFLLVICLWSYCHQIMFISDHNAKVGSIHLPSAIK